MSAQNIRAVTCFPRYTKCSSLVVFRSDGCPAVPTSSMTGSWHPVSVYMTLDAKTNRWLIESIIMKGDL